MHEQAESNQELNIHAAKVIWPKSSQDPRSEQQQLSLRKLAREPGDGLILDCSLVEVGHSEIVNLLMRVRNHAKRWNKEVVLYDVPDTLKEVLEMCNLGSILPCEDDAVAAQQLIRERFRLAHRRRGSVKSEKSLGSS